MSKDRAYWPLDNAPQPDGDAVWRGVNNKLQPAQLPDGYAADAENVRCDTGRPSTRKGVRLMAWASNHQSGDDPGLIRPFGTVLAAGTFSNPITGFEWQVIVTATAAYWLRPGNLATEIPVEAGQSLAGAVDVLQTYNGLILLRGRTAPPLHLSSQAEGFKSLPAPAVGKESMPPMSQAIYFQNRVIGVDGRHGAQYVDSLWVSDIGGVSSVLQGENIYQNFKINRGSADRLVAAIKFNDRTIVGLKDRSVHVVSNIAGTNAELAANATLDTITDEYGCIAPRSVVQVGSDIWFLGHLRGVCSIRQTEDNKLQGVDVPKSLEVQGWIDRINWERASECVAAVHNNKVYFAVPIDGASYNNAVLVYSTLNQAWVSLDLGPAIKVKRWTKFSWQGATRIGFISTDGFVCLYEDGYTDQTGTGGGVVSSHQIAARFLSRGLGGREPGFKRYRRWTLRARNWNGEYSVKVLRDGVFEEDALRSVAKNRVRYMRPYGAADYDPVDPTDDWATPYREDYSVSVPFVVRQPASGGAAFDVLQEVEESGRLRESAQHIQVEVTATRGRIEIGGMLVEAHRGSTRHGTQS